MKLKNEHYSALADSLLILTLTVLPTIIGLGFIIFTTTDKLLTDLYKGGELFLYSVSLLGSSFLIFNQYTVKYKNLNNFSKLVLIIIVIVSVIYAAISNDIPKENAVRNVSIVTVVISFVIFYYAQLINCRHSPDIGETRREEIKTIKDALK